MKFLRICCVKSVMETIKVNHPRLYAFYKSKVINLLMCVVVVSLYVMAALPEPQWIIPAVCASVSFLCAVGYSLWIWMAKPTVLIVNPALSELSGVLTFYFIIAAAFKAQGLWWWVTPAVIGLVALVFVLMRRTDHAFDIITKVKEQRR